MQYSFHAAQSGESDSQRTQVSLALLFPAAFSTARHCLQALLLITQDSKLLDRQVKRQLSMDSSNFGELHYGDFVSAEACRFLMVIDSVP